MVVVVLEVGGTVVVVGTVVSGTVVGAMVEVVVTTGVSVQNHSSGTGNQPTPV